MGDNPKFVGNLKSKKFIAYLLTISLLVVILAVQIYWNYSLALVEKDPVVTEKFMTWQLYIIGALSVVYIGGQAALDAVLGWMRGGREKGPQVVVNTAEPRRYGLGEIPEDLVSPLEERD
jgi:hypothetical protein